MKLSEFLFKNRSYTPIPFFILMLVFINPNLVSVIVGFLVAFLGEFFRFWGVSFIGSESRTTGTVGGSKLIVSGPYSYTRNPLYIGNIFIYSGIGIMSNALFPFLFISAFLYFVFQYHLIVKDEEKYLRETFNEDFILYCNNVRRFVPRLTPWKNSIVSQQIYSFKTGWKSERRTLQGFSISIIIIIAIFIYRTYGK